MPKIAPTEMIKRRTRILEAARTCFIRHGIDGTSMDEICTEAGLSKGALYGHFASKEELTIAVIDLGVPAVEKLGSAQSLAELRSYLLAYPYLGDRYESLTRMEFEAWSRSFVDSDLRERLSKRIRSLDTAVGRSLKVVAASSGLKLRVKEETAAQLLLSLVLGSIWRRATAAKSYGPMLGKSLDALLELLFEPASHEPLAVDPKGSG